MAFPVSLGVAVASVVHSLSLATSVSGGVPRRTLQAMRGTVASAAIMRAFSGAISTRRMVLVFVVCGISVILSGIEG